MNPTYPICFCVLASHTHLRPTSFSHHPSSSGKKELMSGDHVLTRGQGEATYLARVHAHPRDVRVVFDEGPHTYTVDGKLVGVSVTGLLASVENDHFDAEAVARKLAATPSAKYNAGRDLETGLWLPMTAEAILAQWDTARDLGTDLHGRLERHLNKLPVTFASPDATNAKEFAQATRWLATCGMEPFRTEWVIFDEDCDVAGSVDFVGAYPDGTLGIVDWKRCIHGGRGFAAHFHGTTLKPPLEHLQDCKLSHWLAQVNVYRVILERKYGATVRSMQMVVLQADQEEAAVYTHPRDDRVARLLDDRASLVQQALAPPPPPPPHPVVS